MTETIITPDAEWEEKCWGRTRCVVSSPFYSRHELEVVAGGYCSFHYHRNRGNRFIVPASSVAVIRVVQAFGWELKRDLVPPKIEGPTHLDLPALVPHQFQVLQSGEIIEEYWSDRAGKVDVKDIVRLSAGGVTEVERLAHPCLSIFRADGTRWMGGIPDVS